MEAVKTAWLTPSTLNPLLFMNESISSANEIASVSPKTEVISYFLFLSRLRSCFLSCSAAGFDRFLGIGPTFKVPAVMPPCYPYEYALPGP